MSVVARRAAVGVVIAFAVTGGARSAVAQTSGDHDVAVAEFREARKLIDAGDCPTAMGHLERSLAREPSVGARMSMAECQEKTDLVKAWRSLAEASLLAYTNHDDRLTQAEARMGQIERRVGTFHLGVSPSDLVRPGLDVRIDGRSIDRFLLRRGIVAIEPGDHVVEASAPDRGTFTAKASAPVPGAAVLVPIELPDRPPVSSIPPSVPIKLIGVTPPEDAKPRDEGRITRRTVGYSIGAVGIVGVAVGAVFGIVALGRASDLDEACGGDRSKCQVPPSTVASIRDAGTTAATASTISLVVGGVALGTGIALVLWPSSKAMEQKGTASASASVHVTPSGVGIGGSF